jgi:membrane protease YdiL (CAAX protease family)
MKDEPVLTLQLCQFFIFTFLFSWLLWLPNVLLTYDLITANNTIQSFNNVLIWLAGTGPSLVAIILITRQEGKAKLKDIFIRVVKLKLGYWYLPIFLFLPFVLVLAHIINVLLFNATFPKTGPLSEPWWIPVLFIVFFIMQFAEELGWRGYALDRLQTKMNATLASIVLGSIWAIWQIPMFISSGFGQYKYNLPFLQFVITLVLISIVITWLQNNCKGSLFPAFILHAQVNLSGDVLPLIEKNTEVQGDYAVWIIANILLLIFVVAIIKYWNYKKLKQS